MRCNKALCAKNGAVISADAKFKVKDLFLLSFRSRLHRPCSTGSASDDEVKSNKIRDACVETSNPKPQWR